VAVEHGWCEGSIPSAAQSRIISGRCRDASLVWRWWFRRLSRLPRWGRVLLGGRRWRRGRWSLTGLRGRQRWACRCRNGRRGHGSVQGRCADRLRLLGERADAWFGAGISRAGRGGGLMAAGWAGARNERSRIERERDESEASEEQVGGQPERDDIGGLQR